ncbi:hypothetical protein [Micropruina sp.]|uniref:hypothetical protein n=1 Tax=Micropruina sp. TaxID=2737536 RepID=UPI0039E32342
MLAAPFRAHVEHTIAEAHVPWPAFAVASNLPVPAVHTLLFGRGGRALRRLEPGVATRILKVGPADLTLLRISQVTADLAAARLRALLRSGVPADRVARWCDLSTEQMLALADGRVSICSRLTEALAVAAERMMFAPALGRRAA